MDRHSMPRDDRTQAPWMRNERWSSGVIRDQSAENLRDIWIFAILWNLVTALALIPNLKGFIHGHDWSRMLSLVFPAIGMGLLLWAGYRSRRIRKFGASVFHLRILPASPGGDLDGTIQIQRKFRVRWGIQLKLVCIHRFMSGIGRNSRVIDRIVWNETQTLDHLGSCDEGTEIPILFHIPPDVQPSSDLPMGDGIRWRLEVRCQTTGVSYYSRFEVPVFVVGRSGFAKATVRDLVSSRRLAQEPDPQSSLRERGVIFERLSGGRVQIYVAAARNKPAVILTSVIGLALIAGAIKLASLRASGMDRIITVSIGSIILMVGGYFDFKAILNWLVSSQITVRYGSLTIERNAPMYSQERTFKLGDVSDVFRQIQGGWSSASGSGSAKKKGRYSLVLKTRDGDLIWLAKDIVQKDYAAWLAEEIRDTFGVGTQE